MATSVSPWPKGVYGAKVADDCGVCRDPAEPLFSRNGIPDYHLAEPSLPHIARNVIGWRLMQETSVHDALDDVASNVWRALLPGRVRGVRGRAVLGCRAGRVRGVRRAG
jgi:hypothetical protein